MEIFKFFNILFFFQYSGFSDFQNTQDSSEIAGCCEKTSVKLLKKPILNSPINFFSRPKIQLEGHTKCQKAVEVLLPHTEVPY